MGTGKDPSIGEVSPIDAWNILKTENDARLIDVRTVAEWGFVGVPDMSDLDQKVIFAEWATFPGMSANPNFVNTVVEKLETGDPGKLLFLCRSGVRSLRAAQAVTAHFSAQGKTVTCLNVLEGFEGDPDSEGHRGKLNGWKYHGLAWRQS